MPKKAMSVFSCLVLLLGISLAHSAVEYLGEDEDTQGNWKGKYGASGGVIFEAGGVDGQNRPGQDNDQLVDGIVTTYTDGSPNRWNWATDTNDERGLEYVDPQAGDRIGACQYGNGSGTLVIEVDSTDYQVATYHVDWDSVVRAIDVVGFQGNTPPNDPDLQLVNPEYNAGIWLLWHVTGASPFNLQITQQGGANWVISAVMIDDLRAVSSAGKLTTTWGQIKRNLVP